MLAILDKIKPHATTISWVAGAVISIVSTAFAIDQRYAHAEEVEKFKTEQSRAIVVQGQLQTQALDMFRRQMLEDKIFELELIPPNKRSQIENAKLERYKRQLQTPPAPQPTSEQPK